MSTQLRLAVITMAAQIPDLAQPEDWDEAVRLRYTSELFG